MIFKWESSQQGKNPPPRVVRGTNTEGAAPARSDSRAKKVEADINEGGMTPKRKSRTEKDNQQDPNEESMTANLQG
ncbi:hypothetical protein N7527_011429 [Penicillium freii]|nr:hypothetical protein N7527_011429 [Penicillium freii]